MDLAARRKAEEALQLYRRAIGCFRTSLLGEQPSFLTARQPVGGHTPSSQQEQPLLPATKVSPEQRQAVTLRLKHYVRRVQDLDRRLSAPFIASSFSQSQSSSSSSSSSSSMSCCRLLSLVVVAMALAFAAATAALDLHGPHRWPGRYKLYGAPLPSSSSSSTNVTEGAVTIQNSFNDNNKGVVVLVPGLDGCTSFFAELVPELTAAGHTVLVFHLPLARPNSVAASLAYHADAAQKFLFPGAELLFPPSSSPSASSVR